MSSFCCIASIYHEVVPCYPSAGITQQINTCIGYVNSGSKTKRMICLGNLALLRVC